MGRRPRRGRLPMVTKHGFWHALTMFTSPVRVFAAPVALLLALGLAACQDQIPVASTSASSGSTAPVPSASSSPSTKTPTPTASSSGRRIKANDLNVGDCFDNTDPGNTDSVNDVSVTDCSSPHTYEVYNISQISGSTYPSDMDLEVSKACYDSFEDYVGISVDRTLAYTTYTLSPSPGSWTYGDRIISCAVGEVNGGMLTGSAKGTAR